ncbi:MMPL family transporter [Streptomyces sp. NPDC058299]|uniref:MMPL family transporter n=1 Tax=Streptomyces sp. NPDC058299 TaxID=3346435 RepID=UPI0036E06443
MARQMLASCPVQLSRIVEEPRRGHPTPVAVAVALGLQHTGRLFTSAAPVFVTVAASLALSSLPLLKVFGVGLALAVLLDCTVVRALLVPALMKLFGDANWWLPSLPAWARQRRQGRHRSLPAPPRTCRPRHPRRSRGTGIRRRTRVQTVAFPRAASRSW